MKVFSVNHREKLRQAKIGKSNVALIGRKYPKEHCQAISQALIGRHLSNEHKNHIGLGNLGKKKSPESVEKGNLKRIGQKRSFEVRQKMSLAHIGQENFWKGKVRSVEFREKIRQANLGKILTEETKQKMRDFHGSERGRELARKAGVLGHKACNRRPTKPELEMQSLLDEYYPNEYKYSGDGSVIIGYKNPDFININGKKSVIEIFGDYWHKMDSEKEKIKHYAEYGFKCLIVWEKELGDKKEVLKKIINFKRGE